MKIVEDSRPDFLYITLKDMDSLPPLTALEKVFEKVEARHVVLDCSGFPYFSAELLKVLAIQARAQIKKEKKLFLFAVPSTFRSLIDFSGLSLLVQRISSLDEISLE